MYEDFVKTVCGENWKTDSEQDKEGGYGVAIVVAFMKGIKPDLNLMAKHLGIESTAILQSFNNLMDCGIFSDKFNAKKDRMLLGHENIDNAEMAWMQIAGISANLIYQKMDD
jgi:hypothetical protein